MSTREELVKELEDASGAPPPYPPEDKNEEFENWCKESDDGADT